MDLILNVLGFFMSVGVFLLAGVAIIFVLTMIMALSDPNEVEAKKYGWDNWAPHDPLAHSAYMAHSDHEKSFSGEMDSIGCFFNDNGGEHPVWFSDKHDFINFLKGHYLYLTAKYSSRTQDREYNETVESEYQKIVYRGLLKLEKQ